MTGNDDKLPLIRDVMGASHVYCSAVDDLLDRTLEEASDSRLAMSQVKLLLLVARPGQQFKVTDIADFLGVTNAAASRAIDRLVQRDLVDRSISPHDRRAVTLSLTPNGEELLDRFQRVRNRELVELLGPVDAERLRLAVEILDELSVKLLALDREEEERCLRCGIHFRQGCVVRDVLGRECAVAGGLYGTDRGRDQDSPGVPEGPESGPDLART